jgi:hypothetical protein
MAWRADVAMPVAALPATFRTMWKASHQFTSQVSLRTIREIETFVESYNRREDVVR